ncbi:MAG: hypothetical protein AAGA75_17525 [Cyanobacteria bacterium P01_E01_bin.6]
MKAQSYSTWAHCLLAIGCAHLIGQAMLAEIPRSERLLNLVFGVVGIAEIVQHHRRQKLGLNAYPQAFNAGINTMMAGLGEFVAEFGTATEQVSLGKIPAQKPALSIRKIVEMAREKAEKEMLSFLDDDFWGASKVVMGARGSGKSTVMTADAIHWLRLHSQGRIDIIDKHNNIRIPGIPDEAMQEMMATSKVEAIALIDDFLNDLEARTNGSTPKEEWVPRKLMIDEVVATLSWLGDERAKQLVEAFDLTLYEGRKFGPMEITIGLHEIKKERTGFDLTSLLNAYWVMTGSAMLEDINIRLPSSVDRKTLLEKRDEMVPLFSSGKHRVCVYKRRDDKARVGLLPDWSDGLDVSVEWSDPLRDWWESCADIVWSCFSEGKSPTATVEHLNQVLDMPTKIKKSSSDDRWEELKFKHQEFISSKETVEV